MDSHIADIIKNRNKSLIIESNSHFHEKQKMEENKQIIYTYTRTSSLGEGRPQQPELGEVNEDCLT